jgi:uncharacterized membrane protein
VVTGYAFFMSGKGRKPNSQAPARPQKVVQPQRADNGERVMMEFEAYQGALPHPNIVRGWEDIEEGSFNRILTMAENDQKMSEVRARHEMAMEKAVVEANIRDGHRELNLARNGQIPVFLSVLGLVLLAGYLLQSGNDIGGYAALVTALAPIITAVVRQVSPRKENPNEGKK